MKTANAEGLMIPLDSYPHIPYWFTIRECIALLHHSELEINGKKSLARAVLVFDEEYKLLGMVRRRDILRGLESVDFLNKEHNSEKMLFEIDPDPNLLEVSAEPLIRKIKEKAETTVGEIMVPVKATVNHDDHLIKIIYEISEYQHGMIAVMEEDVVVGVIRTVEIMDEIRKILGIDHS